MPKEDNLPRRLWHILVIAETIKDLARRGLWQRDGRGLQCYANKSMVQLSVPGHAIIEFPGYARPRWYMGSWSEPKVTAHVGADLSVRVA